MCIRDSSNARIGIRNSDLVLSGRFRQCVHLPPAAGVVQVDRDYRTVSAVPSPCVNGAAESRTAEADNATSGLGRTPNDAIIRTSQLVVCLAYSVLARPICAGLPAP